MALKHDLFVVGAGRLVAVLMALLSIRAVTTFLTPSQYGELAVLLTIQMFCGLFLINPVGQHINLHTNTWWEDGTLLARMKSYRYYIFVVSIVGSLVSLNVVVEKQIDNFLWTGLVVFLIVATGTWNATVVPMLNMLGYRRESVLWTMLTMLVGLAASILFVMWRPSAIAWLAGQVLGMLTGAIGAKFSLERQAIVKKQSQVLLPLLNKQIFLTYCLPLSLATGLMWLQLSGYRLVIERYWGLVELGFFAVGLQLAGQVYALAESLSTQFLYPLFFREVSINEKSELLSSAFSDLLNTLVPLYFILTGVVIVSSHNLLKILVAPQFQGAMLYVMLGAGIELCRVLGNLLSNAAHIKRKTSQLVFPYATGAATSISLIYLAGIWNMNIALAGVALIVGAVAMLLIMWFTMRRQIAINIDVLRWSAGIVGMFFLMGLAMWLPKDIGQFDAFVQLLIVLLVATVASIFLLWGNPALVRLINVKLGKN